MSLSLLSKGRAYGIKAIMGILELAAFYAALSARELPLEMPMTSIWCPVQWSTATSRGRFTTSSSLRISGPCLMGGFHAVKSPRSFHKAAWAHRTRKAYLESVYMLSLESLPNLSAQVKAVNLAFCTNVPGGRGLASAVC